MKEVADRQVDSLARRHHRRSEVEKSREGVEVDTERSVTPPVTFSVLLLDKSEYGEHNTLRWLADIRHRSPSLFSSGREHKIAAAVVGTVSSQGMSGNCTCGRPVRFLGRSREQTAAACLFLVCLRV